MARLSRIACVTFIALWELLASGTSSLLMSQDLFKPQLRGIIIISLSFSTIFVRIIQIIYYKFKLYSIASKKQMIIKAKSQIGSLDERKTARKMGSIAIINSPEQELAAYQQKNINANVPQTQIQSNNNYSSSHVVTAGPINIINNRKNNHGDDDDAFANMTESKKKAQERAQTRKKKKEEIASDLQNYNVALLFISFSTFSDACFDIIQGFILVFGYTNTTQPLAVLGSIIGFSSEVLDFFEEIFGFGLSVCRQGGSFQDCTQFLESLWCVSVSLGCIAEQSISIYVLIVSFECVGKWFGNNIYETDVLYANSNKCDSGALYILFIGFTINILSLIAGFGFLIYAIKRRRVRITLDPSVLDQDEQLAKELAEADAVLDDELDKEYKEAMAASQEVLERLANESQTRKKKAKKPAQPQPQSQPQAKQLQNKQIEGHESVTGNSGEQIRFLNVDDWELLHSRSKDGKIKGIPILYNKVEKKHYFPHHDDRTREVARRFGVNPARNKELMKTITFDTNGMSSRGEHL